MNEQTPDAVEKEFFTALIEANVETLDRVLADDFVLIDVMTGSEVAKSALLDVVGGGHLKFARIDRLEFRVRVYGTTAVVTGRTEMSGRFGGQPFGAGSRYTHVFVEQGGQWRMVAAQGTQIAPNP
ncbi:MAG: nuclear transport factor 2 family protein [Blastocatellia bacterium]